MQLLVSSRCAASCQASACTFVSTVPPMSCWRSMFGPVDPSPGHAPFIHRQKLQAPSPTSGGVLVIDAGPGGNLLLRSIRHFEPDCEASSTSCRPAHISTLTEPPCEAVVVGPSLLDPVFSCYLIVSSRSLQSRQVSQGLNKAIDTYTTPALSGTKVGRRNQGVQL